MSDIYKALFEWSMNQADGTHPRPMNPQDQQWLEDALKSYIIDLGQRMKEIKEGLDEARPTTLAEKEQLLDELMEIVEGIDQAKDLHTIGGLPTLLELLRSEHTSLRWRAAEVVATCVQNNPPVQKWFMDGGALPLLMALLSDADVTCQTKGLLAISCLIRGFHPALLAFREQGGIGVLCTLLRAEDASRLQRKCLQMLAYCVRTIPGDRLPLVQAGVLAGLVAPLASDDNDLRQAALNLALQLGADTGALRLMQQDAAFEEQVRALQMRLDTLPCEDWDAVQDEVAALKRLTEELERQLPPASAADGAAQPLSPRVSGRTVLVDDPDTTGASPSQLQLAVVQDATQQ